jgi:hypothetical protein
MSIAWSTVVVILLLLPGFFFFVGLYAPERLTREQAPISALGQLAGIVAVSFVVHAVAVLVIDQWLCRLPALADEGLRCVALVRFVPILRAEASTSSSDSAGQIGDTLDGDAGRILLYFVAVASASYAVGRLAGRVIGAGWLPTLVSHPWMAPLTQGTRARVDGLPAAHRWMRAHVMTKTSHDGLVVIYEGLLANFYARADGTIVQLVLKYVQSGVLSVADPPSRSMKSLPLTSSREQAIPFLLIAGDEVSNVYFEPYAPPLDDIAAGEKALDAALRALADTRSRNAESEHDTAQGSATPG